MKRVVEVDGVYYYCEYKNIFGKWKRYQSGGGFTDGDIVFFDKESAIKWLEGSSSSEKVVYEC